MTTVQSIFMKPLEKRHIDGVVDIHKSQLGYTLNSRLGHRHLAFMYGFMADHPNSCVIVALEGDKPVGVVSGAAEMEKTKSEMMLALPARLWLNILLDFLKNPSLIGEWQKGNDIGRQVLVNETPVDAILATICVASEFQGLGVGRRLVNALEEFFNQRGVGVYRLDTLIENTGARNFYKTLGFVEVGTRRDSVLMIKRISK
jgi:ribosomal protein S18 acetylase RimI-like enzyme